MRGFFAALKFLTIIPIPESWANKAEDFERSVYFFPATGLLIGGIIALFAWGLSFTFMPVLNGAILTIIMSAISSGLHIDGLADTADGLLSWKSKDKALEIMKDSRIGAMGAFSIASVLLLKLAALSSIYRIFLWKAVVLAALVGRCSIIFQICFLPYVRENGIGAGFTKHRSHVLGIYAIAVVCLICVLLYGLPGLAIVILWLFAEVSFESFLKSRIGGATGDTFGASCEIGETVALIAAAFIQLIH